MIILILFLTITSCCFIHINIETGQIFKDIYFNCGCVSLLIALMFLRKAKLKLSMLVGALIYIGYSAYYLVINNSGWGPDYRNYLICKYALRLALALYFVMAADSQRFSRLKKDNRVMLGIGIIAFSFALIIGQGFLLPALGVLIAIYITPFSEEMWMKFIDALAMSLYISFVIVMTRSFIMAPNEYVSGRYIGLFDFPVAGGLPASIAGISGVYLFEKYGKKITATWLRIVIIIAITLYPIIATFLMANRVSMLSAIFVGIACFVFCAKNKRKEKAKKRGITFVVVLIIGAVLSFVSLKLMINADTTKIDEYVESHGQNSPGMYYINIIRNIAYSETKSGVFLDGTVKNAIDRLSSERFGIVYMGVRQIKLWGNSPRDVNLPNGDYFAHTHNTYLDWLLRFGWIGGGVMILWFVGVVLASMKKVLEYEEIYYYLFMWIIFCVPFFMFECESAIHITFFWLLILQYPIFMNLKTNK